MTALLIACAVLLAPQEDAQELAPRSFFSAPLYLGEKPPEGRSAAVILIATGKRDEESAAELAQGIVERARAGESFSALARSYSDGPEGVQGGLLGTLTPGVLEEAADRFLFAATVGQVSDPIETSRGLTIWTRVERWAASEYVIVSGAQAERVAAELVVASTEGADLATLVEGRDLRLRRQAFERGPADRLLKLATFEAAQGEVFGPLETPLGSVVGRRIPLGDVKPEERENNWIRARALVLITPSDLSDDERARKHLEARVNIEAYFDQALGATEFEALAREHTQEPTAAARAGDLGWIHRQSPTRSRVLDGLFVVEPGALLDPIAFSGGWVLLGRTR